jgi:hypothetical protein
MDGYKSFPQKKWLRNLWKTSGQSKYGLLQFFGIGKNL